MLNIAIEGKFLVGACAAAVVVVRDRQRPHRRSSPPAISPASLVGLLLAWLGIR